MKLVHIHHRSHRRRTATIVLVTVVFPVLFSLAALAAGKRCWSENIKRITDEFPLEKTVSFSFGIRSTNRILSFDNRRANQSQDWDAKR